MNFIVRKDILSMWSFSLDFTFHYQIYLYVLIYTEKQTKAVKVKTRKLAL